MSIVDKIKLAGNKAGKAISKEIQKQQQKNEANKQHKAELVAAENERIKKIESGNISPIRVAVSLLPGEQAYLNLTASRMANTEHIIEETKGISKKKHVIRRAVVGTILMPGIGTIAGAATAGTKHSSTTVQRTVSSFTQVDFGQMVLTNRRVIFIGSMNVTSISYSEMIAISFNGNHAYIKYPSMLNGEYYVLGGENAKDIQPYYVGITQHKM